MMNKAHLVQSLTSIVLDAQTRGQDEHATTARIVALFEVWAADFAMTMAGRMSVEDVKALTTHIINNGDDEEWTPLRFYRETMTILNKDAEG